MADFEIVKAITELVSSLPYGNYSMNWRQKVYDEWLKKYEQDLKIMQSRYDRFTEIERPDSDYNTNFDKPSSIFNR